MNKYTRRSIMIRVVCTLIGAIVSFWGWHLYASCQLCSAAVQGDVPACRRWLFWGADVNGLVSVLNIQTLDYPTGIGRAPGAGEMAEPPLAFAVWPKEHLDRQAEVVALLLAAGAHPNGTGNVVPLMRARTPAMIICLAKHGADLDKRDAYGETALINAANMHDVSLVRALVECGASVNAHTEDGTTALNLVSESAMPLGLDDRVADCRKILIQHGAKN